MIIKNIHIMNFQCYQTMKASFSPLTFIKGSNGTGKTTLGLDAVLFGLYGYCKKNLADLPTRNVSKSCQVIIEVEHKGNNYEILRKYPTALKITKNGEDLCFATNAEGQKYLDSLFGDINYFKKFRMIDSGVGINFLEEGQQALKKILFSVSDEVFNKAKDKLNTVKRNREIYNKDKAVIYTNYPSEKRLKTLEENLVDLQKELRTIENTDRTLSNEQLTVNSQKGRFLGQLETANKNLSQIETSTHCYACKQELSKDTKASMKTKKIAEIEDYKKKIKEIEEDLAEIAEIRAQNSPVLTNIKTRYEKITKLKMRLGGRLKQKDFIYTQRDIEVVKVALKELDNLSTKYLTQSIRILEPIINSVLEKINFKVSFEINDKGKFSITLYKDEVKYNYKDLSTGQKLLLQIAFKLALLLERNEEGIIIADEGLSSLDYNNLLHVLEIFENYPFQLLFILHGINEVPRNVKVIDLNNLKEK